MSSPKDTPARRAQAGEWIEVSGLPGRPSRRGQVSEVLGTGARTHYRVRCDEQHESVFFPTEGARIVHHDRPPHGA